MSRPLRIQFPGALYLITSRGNERRKIFIDDEDRNKFLKLLIVSLKTYRVVLNAYIMMGNHFHLLIQTKRANLSEFMRHFNICYTSWFNYHHSRCGHLYQGRYKAFLIAVDSYLLEVSRYLHLNSVRIPKLRSKGYEQRWQYLQGYHWSSLPGYINKEMSSDFVDYDLILSMVGGRHRYRSFVLDGLQHGISNPFEELKKGVILGSDDFVDKVKEEYVVDGSLRDQPSYRGLMMDVLLPEVLMNCVADALAVDKRIFSVRFGNGVERGIVSELLYRYSGLTQPEIGKLLGGIDHSAVSKLRCRLKRKMEHDKQVKEQYTSTEDKVKEILSSVEI